MTAIVLLFITGALLLTAEVFLPGGIAGVIGGVALVAGSALTFSLFGSGIGLLASVAAVALVCLMLYVELVWLPRTKFGRQLVVESTVSGQSQPLPASAAEVVGQPATALTMLAPTGIVVVAGKRYEAFCRSGLAERGAVLTVVDVDNFRLIVTATNTT